MMPIKKTFNWEETSQIEELIRLSDIGIEYLMKEYQGPFFLIDHNSIYPFFVQAILALNGLLAFLNAKELRIDNKEHLEGNPNGVTDLTDLISKVRNAICHNFSGIHIANKGLRHKIRFCVAAGKQSVATGPGYDCKCDYNDDVRFFFGTYGIYLGRNMQVGLGKAIKKYNEAP